VRLVQQEFKFEQEQRRQAAAGRAWRWLDGSSTLISFACAGQQQCACSLPGQPLKEQHAAECTGSNVVISFPFYGQCSKAGRAIGQGAAID
jgi:hypothetical protein